MRERTKLARDTGVGDGRTKAGGGGGGLPSRSCSSVGGVRFIVEVSSRRSRIPCSPPGPDLKEASHDIITSGISVRSPFSRTRI